MRVTSVGGLVILWITGPSSLLSMGNSRIEKSGIAQLIEQMVKRRSYSKVAASNGESTERTHLSGRSVTIWR